MANALGDLIRADKERTGRSIRELAVDAGDGGLRSRFSHLANTDALTEMPKPDTIKALAHALGVPARVVLHAAAEACGLDVSGGIDSSLATLLPTEAKHLTDADIDQIRALVRTIGGLRAGETGAKST